MKHPEVVDRLAILNAAHPRKLSQGLHHPDQLRKSWYFFFFALPDLPETVVHANQWHFFRHFLHDADPAYTPEEFDRYIEAWSQPGAATGMINYYRSSVRTPQKQAEAALRPVEAPTLVIWGQRDHYLGQELAEPDHDDVPNLDRVERLPNASHWVHHDEAEHVNHLLADFFTRPWRAGSGDCRASGWSVRTFVVECLSGSHSRLTSWHCRDAAAPVPATQRADAQSQRGGGADEIQCQVRPKPESRGKATGFSRPTVAVAEGACAVAERDAVASTVDAGAGLPGDAPPAVLPDPAWDPPAPRGSAARSS